MRQVRWSEAFLLHYPQTKHPVKGREAALQHAMLWGLWHLHRECAVLNVFLNQCIQVPLEPSWHYFLWGAVRWCLWRRENQATVLLLLLLNPKWWPLVNSEYWVLKRCITLSCSISLPPCNYVVEECLFISPQDNLVRFCTETKQLNPPICSSEYLHPTLPLPFNLFSFWVTHLLWQAAAENFISMV